MYVILNYCREFYSRCQKPDVVLDVTGRRVSGGCMKITSECSTAHRRGRSDRLANRWLVCSILCKSWCWCMKNCVLKINLWAELLAARPFTFRLLFQQWKLVVTAVITNHQVSRQSFYLLRSAIKKTRNRRQVQPIGWAWVENPKLKVPHGKIRVLTSVVVVILECR